jgi:propanediol dehydratase small subunit
MTGDDVSYPLSDDPETVETPTGIPLSEVALEDVVDGEVSEEDLSVSCETLEKQAQVAVREGRTEFARKLRRAAELTSVPDDRLLEFYNALRPSEADEERLLAAARELETEHDAELTAELVREAVEAYDRSGIFER